VETEVAFFAGLSLLILGLAPPNSGVHGGQASYDVTAEFSRWWETSEESIFYFETEKACQLHSYEQPEAAGRTKKNPGN